MAGTVIPKRVIADAEFKTKVSGRLLVLAQKMWPDLHLMHVTGDGGKLGTNERLISQKEIEGLTSEYLRHALHYTLILSQIYMLK